MKTLFYDGTTEIKEPNSYSSFENDFCFLVKKNKVANVYNVRCISYDKGVITVDTEEGHVLATPDNSVFFISSIESYEPLLMDKGFMVENFKVSENLCKNRFALSYFLDINVIDVPKYALSSPIDLPFLAKENNNISYEKIIPITKKEQIKKITGKYFSQQWIGKDKKYQVDYRVYVFLGEILATSIRFNPAKEAFSPSYLDLIEVPLIDIPIINLIIGRAKSKIYVNSTNLDDWKKLNRKELLTVGEIFNQEDIIYDIRLKPVEYNSDIDELAKEAMRVCRLAFGMVNIVTDESGIPYVIGIEPNVREEILAKRLGVDRLASIAYLKLEENGFFND